MTRNPSLLLSLSTLLCALAPAGCYEGPDDSLLLDEQEARACAPLMSIFPVGEAHNIGYDALSCGAGRCEVSCPDAHANSDWGGDHHGIDVFARHRAPLLAVADGVIEAADVVSPTSGLRVRLSDACGWEYYYGHLDEATVREGDRVVAGQTIGFMGSTGAASVHLHFNVSYDGDYEHDIDPFPLLQRTSATACGGLSRPPQTVGHNQETAVRFAYGGGACSFSFQHGNYGGGYAMVRANGGECGRMVASVVSANSQGQFAEAAAEGTGAPGEWVQAGTPEFNILRSEYCAELTTGGSLLFSYNALTNTLEDESVRGHGCE